MNAIQLKKLPSGKLQGLLTVPFAATFLTICCLIVISVSLQEQYSEYLLKSLGGPIQHDDVELLDYIKNEILQPPSQAPYHLLGKENLALKELLPSERFYINMTRELFKQKKSGFFIEAGALDGETMSVTLNLEKRQNWSGLLVESDLVNYRYLVTKNRKAWSANVCLSPNKYPSKEFLTVSTNYEGGTVNFAGLKKRAMNGIAKYAIKSISEKSFYKRVQCLPLESLLTALNITHVDLLVLDVEGAEMDILKHMNLDKFIIDVIFMEWKEKADHSKIAKKIESRGYRLFRNLQEDLVFVRKGSVYDTGVSYVIPPNKHMSKTQRKKLEYLMLDTFKKIEKKHSKG